MAWTYSESTCSKWCGARPALPAGASCANHTLACALPRLLVPYLGDPAYRCDERCLRRFRPDDWDPASVGQAWDEVAAEVGAQTDALERAAGGIALTMAAWAGIRQKYEEGKARTAETDRRTAGFPAGHAVRRLLVDLHAKEQKIDTAIAQASLSGLGAAQAAALPIVLAAGGVVLAGWLAYLIQDYLKSSTHLWMCQQGADKVPPDAQADYLAACSPVVSLWSKIGKWVVGGAVVVGVGVVAWKYRGGLVGGARALRGK